MYRKIGADVELLRSYRLYMAFTYLLVLDWIFAITQVPSDTSPYVIPPQAISISIVLFSAGSNVANPVIALVYASLLFPFCVLAYSAVRRENRNFMLYVFTPVTVVALAYSSYQGWLGPRQNSASTIKEDEHARQTIVVRDATGFV
jgi:hypothetical protein